MIGVTIGDKHTYHDWGLIMTSKAISPPAPQLNLVSIPLRDGSLDLTEALTGDVKYNNRVISINLAMIDSRENWSARISEIQNYLHGQRQKIVFDDDKAFYYIGRVVVNEWTTDRSIGNVTLECTVEPYKYDILSSADDWLWDTFDFETGYITTASNVLVQGNETIVILGRKKKTYPTIIASESMQVTLDGTTYQLSSGTNKLYTMLLHEGENELIFTGNGMVTVEYRGGNL